MHIKSKRDDLKFPPEAAFHHSPIVPDSPKPNNVQFCFIPWAPQTTTVMFALNSQYDRIAAIKRFEIKMHKE